MYTLINGSGKLKDSNSKYFLDYISKDLEECNYFNIRNSKLDEIVDSMKNSISTIIAFPLYADSPSNLTIELFDYIYDNNIPIDTNIYLIINCGFREVEHNIRAVDIVKNWCRKINLNYKGSVSIGAGEVVGDTKYRIIKNKVFKDLDELKYSIENNLDIEDKMNTISLVNNWMYCTIANHNWDKGAKKNGLTKEDIRKK